MNKLDKANKYKQINWYPGHMFKSFKIIESELKMMDIVLLLVDARVPYSSMNPQILKILKNKPTVILLNKMDLADPNNLNKWVKYYEDLGFFTMKIDARTANFNRINDISEEVLKDKILRDERRGLKKRNFRTIVLGIPNVGKSTLINQLANRKSAKVGDKPGVTKHKQWVKLKNGFDLLDVPGVLWPKFEEDRVALNLAVTGAIKDDVLPLDEVCYYLINFMQNNYLENLQNRYDKSIEKDTEYVEVLDMIGKVRGALIRGGEIDYDRVYTIILHDLRNKHLGLISLDKI